jgi:hypothetical protein
MGAGTQEDTKKLIGAITPHHYVVRLFQISNDDLFIFGVACITRTIKSLYGNRLIAYRRSWQAGSGAKSRAIFAGHAVSGGLLINSNFDISSYFWFMVWQVLV